MSTLLWLLGCTADAVEGDAAGECQDNVDNDSDGFTDCDDQDCQGRPTCDDPVDSGVDTGVSWETLFSEDFEGALEMWDLSDGVANEASCGVEVHEGSTRYVERILPFSNSDALAYLCWLKLERTIDLSAYESARLRMAFDVTSFNSGSDRDVAVLRGDMYQDNAHVLETMSWDNRGEADNGPTVGTFEMDLDSLAGWATEAKLKVRIDLQSCPDPTDYLCGHEFDEDFYVWIDDLVIEGRTTQ